ncbi:hypothetical protein HMI55_004515 [Coelomomyces lativittatus]|nr:hypothetical protein HMI55_004515 [Coelomomyces lativittatus]
MLHRIPILTPLNRQCYSDAYHIVQKVAFKLNQNPNEIIETTAIYKKTPLARDNSFFSHPSSTSKCRSSSSYTTQEVEQRVTLQHLCLSSQVSCRHDCKHCACARFSAFCKVKNLTKEELHSQIQFFHTEGIHRHSTTTDPLERPLSFSLASVSLHGQGEPLDNPELFPFLKKLQSDFPFLKISLCTVGIQPPLIKLCKEFPKIHVLWSLHTPFPVQRFHLMPSVESQYPMENVLDYFRTLPNSTIHFGYLWMPGNNDSDFHIYALTRLLKKNKRPLCLIRFHPLDQADENLTSTFNTTTKNENHLEPTHLPNHEAQLQAFCKKIKANSPVPVHIQEYFEFPCHL